MNNTSDVGFKNWSPTHPCLAVISELEECVRAGGAFKTKCQETEKAVGRGCSATSDYCCCVAKDGETYFTNQ